MQRAHILIIMALLTVSGVSGCRREIVVVLGTSSEETIDVDLVAPTTTPGLIPAGRAKTAPVLKLKTLAGDSHRAQPGTGGKVTLVVFWGMDVPQSRAAAGHVARLCDYYAAHGVEALGVLDERGGLDNASRFMRTAKVNYPTFVDRGSALKAMVKAAGADFDRKVPWVFIIDAEGRVRFYRQGFRYSISLVPTAAGQIERILETADEDQHIEDYLYLVMLGR